MSEFIRTTRYDINDAPYTAQRSSYCMYIIVFALVKALERVQKPRWNDKIFIIAINRLSLCLLRAHHGNILCDGNRSKYFKTSHNSLISIAVIVKTYNSCSKSIERVSHVIRRYFICKHVSQSQQWPVTLNPTADTPLQIRG